MKKQLPWHKNMKNIKNKKYWKYSSRGREVGEDLNSLSEPEHLNLLQTPYDLAAGPLLSLLCLNSGFYNDALLKYHFLCIFCYICAGFFLHSQVRQVINVRLAFSH